MEHPHILNVISDISPTVMEIGPISVSIELIDKIYSGQINIQNTTLIIIVYIVIPIRYMVLILHVVVVVREDGVYRRVDVYWMKICTIVGQLNK